MLTPGGAMLAILRGMPHHASDERVDLGHAIFGFVVPHAGRELAWNRYYERDHLIAAGACAPWTISVQRWFATRRHKSLRYPHENPIAQPFDKGSFVAGIWVQRDRLVDQQLWVAEQMAILGAQGRTFEERDVLSTASYDYLGGAFRDADGVPPELALDRRYAGIVLTWVERTPGSSLEALSEGLLDEVLPGMIEKSPTAQALCFTPLPKADWWPKASPEVPGVGERVLVVSFVECDPIEVWSEHFAGQGSALEAGGRGRTLFVAPFIPVTPGVDPDLEGA
jgi:hypothetical protein